KQVKAISIKPKGKGKAAKVCTKPLGAAGLSSDARPAAVRSLLYSPTFAFCLPMRSADKVSGFD
ncbi:MAG TPA: hypothetical protein VF717_15310, partial [Pyrinomonadaceae bacterium]